MTTPWSLHLRGKVYPFWATDGKVEAVEYSPNQDLETAVSNVRAEASKANEGSIGPDEFEFFGAFGGDHTMITDRSLQTWNGEVVA